ncbi:unnamed protein product [Gongylonema pulchrum]|uniref:Alpha-1,3-mannosyl-glycoprotein 2-beta-N-acetylglucosaminyltransferase n=1 Tax=Gongylonema pulchrum TaxID=637853 RepID=A0A3P7Q1U4_9BILA|nr:unnamed protein product [Gongylonema pulchrum]
MCLRQSALLSSASKRPQVNDRRILESKTANVLPGAMPPLMQNTAAKAAETKENSPDIHLFSQTNRPTLTSLVHEHFKVSSSAEGEQKPMVVDNNEQNIIAVVLVIAAKRDLAIKNHLQQLIKLRPSASQFPIIVSQDGGTQSVTEVISKFVNENSKISFIHHKEQAKPPAGIGAQSYFYIAQHYKWALNKVFFEMHYKTVIITEDDLDIADDFFSYFTALKPVLIADPTVWCISAWNDNGGANITERKHSEQLYRTDFFPGLG